MADTGVAVIGAGVVGLAVAARLAPKNEVVILERRARHGQETSSRNSEVIHGGMYYPTGSLKARLCVDGNRRLYDLCAAHGVPHARVGKIITAVKSEELPKLDELLARGLANGVEMSWLTAEEARALEPHVPSVGALLSPNTGIVSAHALMDCLLHLAREAGALLQPRAEVTGLARANGEWHLTVREGDEEGTLTAERVVNAAGLEADTIAGLAGIDVEAAGYRQHYWKGSYFSVRPSKAAIVSRLVYPLPGHVGLGVHAVVGLEGRLRFGPDAEHLPDRALDYSVDESKRAAFASAVRRLVPELADEDLDPDMAGIRAKLQGPGEGARDFVIAEETSRDRPGLVSLIGIDSPGLTSALSIAEEVARLIA
ncbi:MAG TPA: NAD(P)/FAD-dependent oxidoreductase [Vicinamibacteria bacterium]|nr:NAD(P)/FAD-dependent oxidoreductase [Vicinamibacteria bacterium]